MSFINSVAKSMNGIKTIETSSLVFTDDNSVLNTSSGITQAQTTGNTALSLATQANNGKINSISFNDTNGVLTLTKADTSTLSTDLDGRYLESVPDLDANKITSGILSEARIPNLNADKITSGILVTDRIPNLNADKINDGTLGTDRIPNLNADKINDGILSEARIPNLNADKITSGTLGIDRIPNLNADKINDGILSEARIPNLNTDKITSGTLGTDRIPELDTSKITSGVFDIARIPSAGAPSNMMTTDTTQTITGVKTFNGELIYSQGTTATNGSNIVNKNYVDSAITNKVSGYADIEMYFTAFTSATGTFYSNTEFELRWNSTYRQPTFKRVYGGGGDWWDIYHQAPATTNGSYSSSMWNAKDDINTNYNGEYYFAPSGAVNINFNLNSYGQRNICFLTRESISTRRVYKIEYWCGSSSSIYIHLTVYQP